MCSRYILMSALLMASASAFAQDKLEVLAHDSIFKDESLQEVKVVAEIRSLISSPMARCRGVVASTAMSR